MRLKNKVAFITGSTRGIGHAMAVRFAEEGAAVVVTGRNTDRGEQVAKSIDASGGKALFIQMDVSVESDVQHAIAETVRQFGGVDVLVNNAAPTDIMPQLTKPLAEHSTEEFNRIMQVGLYGAFWCTKYALHQMTPRGGGSIINISSQAAIRGVPGVAAYTCAKGALNAMTRQLAVEYSSFGIRCNVIVIGMVINKLTEAMVSTPEMHEAIKKMHLTRLGDDNDIANIALFLASDESGFVTGAEIRADGGLTIKAPLVGDHINVALGNQ